MSLPQIPGYNIDRLLGRGGMGAVYYAYPILDTGGEGFPVALKTFEIEPDPDESDMLRFRREFLVVSKLSHQVLVPVYEQGETDKVSWFTMELVEGVTLNRYFQDRASGAPFEELLPIVIQLVEGIEYVHRQGVLHRDLKPQNILVQSDGRVRLLDFGLSLKGGASRLTQSNQSLGTPMYMAPETIRGEDADVRTDIYSLGVIIYELLAGHSPFNGDTFALLFQIMNTPIPEISSIVQIPLIAADLIRRMMHRERDQRPESMEEVLKTLRSIPIGEGTANQNISLSSIPLLGRDQELAELNRCLDERTHVLLWGGIGQGKTRVLQTVAASYRSKSLPTLEIQGSGADQTPLESLWSACQKLGCLESFPDWVLRRFDLLGSKAQVQDHQGSETFALLVRAITSGLTEYFTKKRFESDCWYVLVDDLDQIDNQTRLLIQSWLLSPPGTGPVVVVTARKTIKRIYPHCFGPFQNLSVIELNPLSAAAKNHLVLGWLRKFSLSQNVNGSGTVALDSMSRLSTECSRLLQPWLELNLRFLEELIRYFVHLGYLYLDQGVWSLSSAGLQGVEDGTLVFVNLEELYQYQSRQLEANQRFVLQVLAYYGRTDGHWRAAPFLEPLSTELAHFQSDLLVQGWLRPSAQDDVFYIDEHRRTFVRARTSEAVIESCIEWDLEQLNSLPTIPQIEKTRIYERLYRWEQSLTRKDWIADALELYRLQLDLAQQHRLCERLLDNRENCLQAAEVAIGMLDDASSEARLSQADSFDQPAVEPGSPEALRRAQLRAEHALLRGQLRQACQELRQSLEAAGVSNPSSGSGQKMLAWMRLAGKGLGLGAGRAKLSPKTLNPLWEYLQCIYWLRASNWEVDYLDLTSQLQSNLNDQSPTQLAACQDYSQGLNALLFSHFSRASAIENAQKCFRNCIEKASSLSSGRLKNSLLRDAGLLSVYSGDLSALRALDEFWDNAVVSGAVAPEYLTRGLTVFEWIRIGRIGAAGTAMQELQALWAIQPGNLIAHCLFLVNQSFLYLHRGELEASLHLLESSSFQKCSDSSLLSSYLNRVQAWQSIAQRNAQRAAEICQPYLNGDYLEDRFRHSERLYWKFLSLTAKIWAETPGLAAPNAKVLQAEISELRKLCYSHFPAFLTSTHRLDGILWELQGNSAQAVVAYEATLDAAATTQLPQEEFFVLSRLVSINNNEHQSHLESCRRGLINQGIPLACFGIAHPDLWQTVC